MDTPVINDWSVGVINFSPYRAPELYESGIYGTISGSSKFKDGTIVRTSAITYMKDGVVHTKAGSVYKLGIVSEEYEKKYPNALERLTAARSK
jgi:hypothetical protein